MKKDTILVSNVVDGRDMRTTMVIPFILTKNFTENRNNFTIFFNPWERGSSLPATKISFEACFGGVAGGNFDEQGIRCEEVIKLTNKTYSNKDAFPDYKDYDIILEIPKFKENDKPIVVRINYTIPNFVIKQGLYNTLQLQYPNMGGNLRNFVILPSKTSIPQAFPENSDRGRDYKERWVFELEGTDETFITYINEDEAEMQRWIQLIKGALLGFIGSLLVSLLVSHISGKRQTNEIKTEIKNQTNELRKEFKTQIDPLKKSVSGIKTALKRKRAKK